MQSFPTATKIVCYQIDGEFYERIGQREAVEKPAAIRAMFGDSLCWFVPYFVEAAVPSAKPADKPKLAAS